MYFDLLETGIGWIYYAGNGETISLTGIGFATKAEAYERLERQAKLQAGPSERCDWLPELAEDLQNYLSGQPIDFLKYRLDLSQRTAYQQQVLKAVRQIPAGQTKTYQQVAAQIGSPKSARAVGACMASNRMPILVPCHRVVGASGQLTGFSAPRGIRLKQELLELEGCHQFSTSIGLFR